jgi:ankyrin repeat protein
MYTPNRNRSIGVLLDADAEIDVRAILLRMLGRSDGRSLKGKLLIVGGIDVNEQTFIDEAFENQYVEAYKFLLTQGIDVNATNSDGESMLHRVAATGDAALMKFMASRGANLQAVNNQGLTPLLYFREKHGHRPAVMRQFRRQFVGQQPQNTRQL